MPQLSLNVADGSVREELQATRQPQASATNHGIGAVAPLSLNDAAHADYPLYQQALSAVHRVDTKLGRRPEQPSENLSAAVAVAA